MHLAVTVWRLRPGQGLQHRVWDEECVLYNDLTGDTHRLDLPALELLLALQGGPLDLPGLCRALALDDADAEELDGLAATLAALAALALVESQAC